MKKLLALLLVVSMIFTMVACEKSAAKTEVSSDKSDTTYSVTDSRGKTVTFNKTPEKIIYDMDGWQKVSEEQVISRNPDYIFATDMYSTPDPIGEIMGRTSWYNINAIKNNKVFSADADALTRPGPRLVDAAKELYTKIYE